MGPKSSVWGPCPESQWMYLSVDAFYKNLSPGGSPFRANKFSVSIRVQPLPFICLMFVQPCLHWILHSRASWLTPGQAVSLSYHLNMYSDYSRNLDTIKYFRQRAGESIGTCRISLSLLNLMFSSLFPEAWELFNESWASGLLFGEYQHCFEMEIESLESPGHC